MFAAVDVGQHGAIAVGNESLTTYQVFDMPDTTAGVLELFKKLNDVHGFKLVGVEKQAPASGRTSSFSIGGAYKEWLMMLLCLDVPHIILPPSKWQALAFDGGKKRGKDVKLISIANAARRFPQAELYGPRGGKLDGRADALNMLLAVIKEHKNE